MNYFPVIITFLVLFAVCSGGGLENLRIKIKKTNYNAQIPGIIIILKTYIYEVHDTLELKCGGSNPVYLEWTDKKYNISQKSCSETSDFTLKLENLGEDDHQTTFVCNSTSEYDTVTLILRNREDLSRLHWNNRKECYEILRENNKNCSHNLRQEIIKRQQTQCPKEMIEDSTQSDSFEKIKPGNSTPLENSDSTLLYVGVVLCVIMTLTIITFWIYKCYNTIRKNNGHFYPEPYPVVYAELQINNDDPPKLPNRNDPPYATIVGVLTPAHK